MSRESLNYIGPRARRRFAGSDLVIPISEKDKCDPDMEKRKQEQNWRLRQARERRNWTQREVADQIDLLDVRTLRRWEAGEAFPSFRYRARLCELFAMNAEELGLTPNVDPLLLAKANQRYPEAPQSSTEERFLSSVSLKSQAVSNREKWNRQQLLKKIGRA